MPPTMLVRATPLTPARTPARVLVAVAQAPVHAAAERVHGAVVGQRDLSKFCKTLSDSEESRP